MRGDRRHSLTRRRLLVGGLLVLALALRVGFVETTSYRAVNDAGTYNRFASTIAQHGDYVTGDGPGTGAGGSRGPTAYFPPGYPFLLAGVDLIDGHASGHRAALHGERLAGAVLGTVAVGLIGAVALELFGSAAIALWALGLAAVYPVLVALSGLLVAENLLIVLELAVVWAGLRAARSLRAGGRRPWAWVALTGALVGLATLTHENAAFMLLALGGGLAWAVPGRRISARRIAIVGWLAVACAAVITPWTIRNAIELHHFVPVSDETGITLRGTYNPASAAERAIPWKWRFFWTIPADQGVRHRAGTLTETELSAVLEHRARRYIAAHPGAVASVGWHDLRRMFELEGSAAWQASAHAIDDPRGWARAGVWAFWALCLLALAGLFTRAVRAAPRWPWAVPVLFALTVVFVNVETPRFREPIDPFLLLLAAAALDALTRRLRSSTP